MADSWASPLNNRLSPAYYALLPIRGKLKKLVRGIAHGKMPLSVLDRELKEIPLLDRSLPWSRTGRSTREYLMHQHIYPLVR